MLRSSTTTRRMVSAALALAVCLSAASSHAVWQWMRGAAVTDFKESDWALLKETARKVLNELPDREQANWSNPETGNRGSVVALATFQHEGRKCRQAAMRNLTFRGRDDRSAYTLCQQADGDWIFVSESAIRAAASTDAPAADAEEGEVPPAATSSESEG